VKIRIAPFESAHEPAAVAFNDRMRRAQAPSAFLLPAHSKPPLRCGAVTVTHYVALDEVNEVRGGMICQEHPGVAGGAAECVINISAPLSEGIIDPAYTFVGPALIKHALRQAPHAFVVGMGNAANPLPRLLKAMGWTVRAVPFYFRLLRAGRCVRQLGPLRHGRLKRLAASVAAITGAAALGAAVVHRPSAGVVRAASQFAAEPLDRWSEWADASWAAFAGGLSFGVSRTTVTLPFFYPLGNGGPRAWVLTRNGRAEGWFGLLITKMAGNPYFGDLVVATLTDCVGTPDALRAGMLLAIREAEALGADVLITNQQYARIRESCVAAGWRPAPSNFLLATSRALSDRLQEPTVYITRRDGDGLVNLR